MVRTLIINIAQHENLKPDHPFDHKMRGEDNNLYHYIYYRGHSFISAIYKELDYTIDKNMSLNVH